MSICGIVKPGAPLGVGQLYARYGKVDRNHASLRSLLEAQAKGKLPYPDREEGWLLRYSRRAEITMLGVWDSVAALDWPGATKHDFLERRRTASAWSGRGARDHQGCRRHLEP